MKNAIMEVTYFLNGPVIILMFYCHVILYWEEVASYDKIATLLPLKPKLSGKYQRFSTIDESIKMPKYS